MAYKNGFVVSVLSNKNVVGEEQSDSVILPPQSEYGIRLRNKNDRRAVGEILIDGESQGSFIIDPRSHVDIYRPAYKDAAFKIVSPHSIEAQDFGKNSTSSPNGTVTVKFQFEKPKYCKPIDYTYIWPSYVPPWRSPEIYPGIEKRYIRSCGTSLTSSYNSCVGVTVEGNRTGQSFGSDSVDLDRDSTDITIKLFISSSIPSRHCTNCGSIRSHSSHKFCGQCGTRF